MLSRQLLLGRSIHDGEIIRRGGRDKRARPGNKAMATHYADVHAVQGKVPI